MIKIERNHILQMVKEIVLTHFAQLPVVIYLFGSWARRQEKRTSDIDIGIWSEFPLALETMAELKDKLEESYIPYRVELVDLTKTNSSFLEKVKKEGVCWKDYRKD